MAFEHQVTQVRALRDRMLPTARRATVAVGQLLQASLTSRLRNLKHARDVGAVFNLQGEPRPHLWQTTTSKVVQRDDGQGYISVVGCQRVGAHISIINSGTDPRERKERKFFVPLTSSLRLLGSRSGGTQGIAGHFVFVELRIQRGELPSSKRTTGTGPELAVINETYAANSSAVSQLIADIFSAEMRNA